MNELNKKHISDAAKLYGFPLMDLYYRMPVCYYFEKYKLTDASKVWEHHSYGRYIFEITAPNGSKSWINDLTLAQGLADSHQKRWYENKTPYPNSDIVELHRMRLEAMKRYIQTVERNRNTVSQCDDYTPVDRSASKVRHIFY